MTEQLSTTRHEPGEVKDFYERYPYPLPIEDLDKYRDRWRDPQRLRAEFHLYWPSKPFAEDHSILVAGCGTSQAAKHAIRWPNAKVTGIDFSATSVDCTAELKRKYCLDNLTLHQLPVERAGELDAEFDQIICTGVLHHLPDPDAGLAALRNVLKRDGAMQLMVYAPYGRTGIYMLQEFCRRVGITATDDGISDLVASLKLLPPGHPLEKLLREAPDFKFDAAIADALLNPQDRAYSVPQLFEFLAGAGLTFGRWLLQAPYSPNCGVMSKLPHAGRLSELTDAEQYAAVELFRGTMLTHSVIAYRNDADKMQIGDLSRVESSEYVPVRMPETICVEDRLPDGAAGVLINRAHPYRDIYLPITAVEKIMFDAIDGIRSFHEIAAGVSTETARQFFERLFAYDQVLFDMSGRKTAVYTRSRRSDSL